ncbi:DUF4232 domain-containing protein [Saccharopolyspora sp. K220]|uniref:DUF4232 domain-containing protein n=1 Tax=Saccharopolyspora soli TaxID=2926618 RepID=UPI001F59E970|nr:DUF4232 domain-containing protein [Saccharopolyspora soli]MCI2419701.1 DUF4232 domain-containing protein [Saccharopolyspora soli]
MLNRTGTLGSIIGLFGGVLLLAGCGQPAADSAPAPAQGGSIQRDGAMSEISAGSAGANAVSSNCSATDFSVDLNIQPDRPGVLLMAVTNDSQQSCTLNGWVDLAATDMAGDPITEVPTERVEMPGAPMEINLDPGESAFAGVHLELGDKADPDTFVGTGFTATPPGTAGSTNAEIIGANGEQYFEFPIKSMQIGSLQPSAQGVTF